MAGIAALRAGAGLSTVATAKSVLGQPLQDFIPKLMTEPLAETEAGTISMSARERIEELAKGKSCSCDWSRNITKSADFRNGERVWWRTSEIAMVLDADGLNAFEVEQRN